MTVRYPRCWLSVNGAMIPCIKAEVCRKSKRASDTFSATLSITEATKYGITLQEWADWQPVDVSVVMSSAFGEADRQVMVTGKVDKPEIHWTEMHVSVSGRDKSASLTEKKRNQKFQNKKASEIVSEIAKDHGLTAVVTDTGDHAGKKYDADLTHLVLNRSDYEVISDLAEREGYRWFVDGTSLYFEPKETQSDVFAVHYTPPTPDAYATGNIIELTTSRNMTAARPQKVTVKSWHHRDKKAYQAEADADGVGDPVEYEHHHNLRSQDQVEKLAKSRLHNAKRHDCSVSIRMPGDLNLDVRQKLQLFGTGTIYDQTYDIDELRFVMGWGEAFTMHISSKAPKGGVQ
jgi:phage protein D